MSETNLFNDNIFLVKVKTKKDIKEIQLRPYSFAVQTKLMESGLLNGLTSLKKDFSSIEDNSENVDFVKLGKMMRLAVEVIFEMLPKEIKITKTLDDFMEDIVEGEPLRFITWLMGRFEKTNSFLAPAPQVAGATPKQD